MPAPLRYNTKESGDMVFGPTTAETKEFFELFIQCMNNGWIDPDWVSFT